MSVEHLPQRPSWTCRTCYQDWPCNPAREHLAAEHRGDRLSLLILMWLYLDDFAGDATAGQLGDAHERFIAWARQPAEPPITRPPGRP